MRSSLLLPLLAAVASAVVANEISDDLHFNLGLLPRQGGSGVNNLQVFAGALGGAAAPAITQSDDPKQPFEVEGDKFVCAIPANGVAGGMDEVTGAGREI